MTKVFIASRIGAKTKKQFEKNLNRMRAFARFALKRGFHPIPTALTYCSFMDDFSPEERKLGQEFGRADMLECQQVWALEDGVAFSDGVRGDMKMARESDIQVQIWNADNVANYLKENDPYGYKLWLKGKQKGGEKT
ncbi:hypothetical protein A3G55_01615 [Candidatus Giovannonibacteria bacterium RIFCSPLOWO2_12_FULL_44_25]|uniref:DUF7768 domain-containing protein n=3 Tax=Parcubacteria group TaxID=1794811 RepID=A0A837IGM6_9BACT|nr:MAG: hypothetical protein UW15_C0004G0008 [Parcubacteria group bacterium GW2011_GWC1_44_10]KKT60143.1 MAG: hypothetical protein UW53_C0003G0054 [Candidatus Giovannonibacteria bacterium GW2011_GWA1_44_25]KKU12645.1 MAG: hypothetical protein UX18_C0016G0008 [Candidatus Azambacteria bacterium GW2011_GWC2_45_7b]KKU29990.1 MAG: hypothetical protein UX43_C0003G0083 [Candidatus Giovannonibacteria bacterium GW2011_GWB1_46_20]OGF49348.1 MAG: hypothetical protein A2120_03450 [Candidatus Giovannonibact